MRGFLCSSVQPKTKQLACFAQTLIMALELVHVACKNKTKGNIIIRSLAMTRGSTFFHKLEEKGFAKTILGCSFPCFRGY